MAGYNGFSKSNNAVEAEAAGRKPASALAKALGCKTGAVRDLLGRSEWHHSSSYYNEVDYYDEPELMAAAVYNEAQFIAAGPLWPMGNPSVGTLNSAFFQHFFISIFTD